MSSPPVLSSPTRADSDASGDALVILLPVFDDWVPLAKLLPQLDEVLSEHGLEARLLIVDDGSVTPPGEALRWREFSFRSLTLVDVLHLRRNLGHQRAIAIGLTYVDEKLPCSAVVVMDSDGEDDPGDVPRLLQRCREHAGQKIVFAERTRRSESLLFRGFYLLYKLLHVVLTGQGIRVGNFSVIPRVRLGSLVAVAEIWNHYAAAVFTSRQPFDTIPTARTRRLAGQSKMNFVSLVTHGLSAISVFGDLVAVRLLVVASMLIVLALVGIGSTVALRLLTDLAIPGWATYTTGVLLILLSQAIMFTFVLSFGILAGRSGSTFIPLREYAFFVKDVETVYKK